MAPTDLVSIISRPFIPSTDARTFARKSDTSEESDYETRHYPGATLHTVRHCWVRRALCAAADTFGALTATRQMVGATDSALIHTLRPNAFSGPVRFAGRCRRPIRFLAAVALNGNDRLGAVATLNPARV